MTRYTSLRFPGLRLWRRRVVLRPGGVVPGIGCRHLGADLSAPGVQPCAELPGQLGPRSGQVVLLADVGRDVVELHTHVVEELDEFEVAGPDRTVRHRPAELVVLVVRVMPEQSGTPQSALAAQDRGQAHAVGT